MRSEWTVSKKSWHGRLYLFWRRNASYKVENYKENLCHYVRVLLFWAPLSLFINLHPKKHPWIRPWSVVLGATIPSALVVSTILWPGKVGNAFLFTLACFAAAAVFAGLMGVVTKNEQRISKGGRALRDGVKRIFRWVPPLGRWLGNKVFSPVGHFLITPFMTVHETAIPWLGFLVFLAWVGVCIKNPLVLLITLGACVTLAVAAAVLFGVFCLTVRVRDWYKARPKTPKPERTDPSFFKVAKGFIVAKKHRVCPLIDVEE